jgi:hypothetical protein
MVRLRYPSASLNLLWALAAALEGIDWRDLPPESKNRLRLELTKLTAR